MNTSTSTYSNLFDININDILDDELNLNFDESNPILTNEDTNIENEFLAFFDDVGGSEIAPSPITHHDIESDSTIESDSKFEEHLKEDYEETD
ncbi:17707_t:CDS:1, partial [Funneliformis geosporum]